MRGCASGFTVEGVHRELIEQHVTGETSRGLRVGRQADYANAPRQHDLELLDVQVKRNVPLKPRRGARKIGVGRTG